MTLLEKFIQKVLYIKSLKPRYRQPGDGSDGTCDCVGLIIGAMRRAGIKWSGIHGSNWFARKEISGLTRIQSQAELKVGDIVFQVFEVGQKGYALPARYKKGGQYYNGDVRDYMHIGVVTSVNPFGITHMWKPTVQTDTSIGKYWVYKGWLKKLGTEPKQEEKTIIPRENCQARVTAKSGKTVKMRKEPSTKCRYYEDIPIGAIVTIKVPGEEWAKINYNGMTGYMMAKFLEIIN